MFERYKRMANYILYTKIDICLILFALVVLGEPCQTS